ncbi:S-LOCUS LECTIN KINASE FAMILY PROTEIN [Salix koriyanagi]|uniref:S-LOCUS LECTIN KINASE FAMILY PROTEIN n=1 Tax=Salix koriyanagi TaxID=2511006 RepID=A0A9Q1A4Z8_9ROSI|nr:S-LOCUS LECTIN KINASE FAMILY PROTEIN [Salix koriyanagi]
MLTYHIETKSCSLSDTIKLAVHILAPPTSQSCLQSSLAAVMDCGNSSVVNGKNDRFFSSNNLGLPSNSQTVEARGAQECESACLSRCNCTAYAYDGSLCSVWSGDLLDMKQLGDDSNEKTIYIRLAASEFSSSKNDRGIVIGGVVGSVVIASLFGLAILERNADLEELTRICKVACWCIQDDEAHRPSMGLVVQILEGVVNVNPPPIPRSLQVFVENQESIIFFTESSSSQSS